MNRSATAALGVGLFGNVISQARSNPRVGYGLCAIVIITLMTGLLYFDDLVESDQQAVMGLQHQQARLEALSREHDWANRHRMAEALSAQLQSRLWEAETDGLARAGFQDWLRGLAAKSGLNRVDVHVEIESNSNNSLKVRKMSATLSGSFTPHSLEELLDQLLRSSRMIIIDRLRIQHLPIPRIELMVATYLRPGTKADHPENRQVKAP